VLKITFTADATFQGGTVTISDISISDQDNNGYDSEDVKVKVTTGGGGDPETPTTYAIHVASAENGTIAVDKANAEAGETVKVTVTPAEGYELEAISVMSGDNVITLTADFTFTMPAADVTVSATFKKVETPLPAGFGLFMELPNNEKRILQGQTIKATVYLNPGDKTIKALQCTFELPEWLTMAKPKAEKSMWSADDEEYVKPSVAFNEENLSLAVYHGEGLAFSNIEDGSIKVLTVEFTAAANDSDDPEQNRYNDKIIMKGISLSDKDNNGIDLDDVEIPVFYKVGVSDIEVAPATNDAYTISGVRVRNNAMPRGLYIINGKKVVVK
jgi:hypothetical protein